MLWLTNFRFPFYQICVQNPWQHKISLVEDFNTGGPSSFAVRMEYLFAFQFCYCECCVESRWEREGGGAESIILLIFVLWHCFNHRWVVRWGRKSYLGPAEIASFPIRDLSWHNKHESSGMLYRLDISTFSFYEPLLFEILFPRNFIDI